MQSVLEFANVAGPGRAQQGLPCLAGQIAGGHAIDLGVFDDEMIGESDGVAGALAQRWQPQVDDVEAE